MQAFVSNRVDRSKVRKTLRENSGRNVDCLDINAQPALKGLPILPLPAPDVVERMSSHPKTPPPPVPELFASNKTMPERCEEGTVPVLDITMDDVRRFATLDDFFRKTPTLRSRGGGGSPSALQQDALPGPAPSGLDPVHEHAVISREIQNRGAYAYFNVWNPYTELSTEFSLAQIWVIGTWIFGTETVEAGFNRYDVFYGDSATHFFIYSTRDEYRGIWAPNCYNNSCGDFVQVSSTWYPGAAVPTSEPGGSQWNASVEWYKGSGIMDAWWLIAFGQVIGYYPRGWYGGIAETAAKYEFGGEIVNAASGRHTETDMGNGYPPGPNAAWMWYLQYWTPSDTAAQATGLFPIMTNFGCYDIYWSEAGPTFLQYGGTGYQLPACP